MEEQAVEVKTPTQVFSDLVDKFYALKFAWNEMRQLALSNPDVSEEIPEVQKMFAFAMFKSHFDVGIPRFIDYERRYGLPERVHGHDG